MRIQIMAYVKGQKGRKEVNPGHDR